MAFKRDFQRAFDIPVGLHVAAELQYSPAPNIPGQWPEEIFYDADEVAPTPNASIFSTMARFATSISLEISNIPERLRKIFVRPQQIIAVPVIREDDSSKRRLVDAGLAPVTPKRADSPLSDVAAPRLWIETPPTPSPQYTQDFQDEDSDGSLLDWCMEDISTGTPPPPPQWLQRPERRILTPKTRVISPNSQFNILRHAPVTPMRKQLLKKQLRAVEPITITSPVARQPNHTLASPVSPNLHITNLKRQALRSSVLSINAPIVAANAQLANVQYKTELEARENQDADAQTSVRPLGYLDPAEVFDNDLSYLADADSLDSQFESLHSPLPGVDNLSSPFEYLRSPLPDAGNPSSTFDPLRAPTPSPSCRRIRWAGQSRVKPFYFDERVSEMLDSTLESIRSPVPKPDFRDDDEDGDSCDDVPLDDPEPMSDSEDSVDGPSLDDPLGDSLNDSLDNSLDDSLEEPQVSKEFLHDLGDYINDSHDSLEEPEEPQVSKEFLHDLGDYINDSHDSLEESQLSKEILQELEEDFKKLLAKQPPPSRPKPLISPLSDPERTQLEDIALKSKHGQIGCYPIIPDKISARDFGTLLPDLFNGSAKAWLNDEIVNQYLAILTKTWNDDAAFVFQRGGPAPPYHAFSSHWYSSIQGGVKKVERWASRAGLGGPKFMDAKLILFPICDGSHWRLLAVRPQQHTIEYLDSLGWDGSKYTKKLRDYLQHELKGAYHEEDWTVLELQRSSRQLNGSDCGVFVLMNALVVLRGDETKKVLACNGMQEARERIAMTIITGHAVELDY